MVPQEASGAAEWFERYGAWAVVVVCLFAIVVLWRQVTAERKDHTAQLERIGKEHKAEMTILLDRLITVTNAQVEKFSNLAEQSGRVVDALTRRVKSPTDGGTT